MTTPKTHPECPNCDGYGGKICPACNGIGDAGVGCFLCKGSGELLCENHQPVCEIKETP